MPRFEKTGIFCAFSDGSLNISLRDIGRWGCACILNADMKLSRSSVYCWCVALPRPCGGSWSSSFPSTSCCKYALQYNTAVSAVQQELDAKWKRLAIQFLHPVCC